MLQIKKDANIDDIKRAYKTLALKYHPDKCGDNALFIELNKSYQILCDPDKRKIYDESLTNNIDYFRVFMKIIINLKKPHKDIELSIKVTLNELYLAKIKKIGVKVLRDNVFTRISLYISLLNYKPQYIFKNMGDNKESDIIVNIDIVEDSVVKIDNVLSIYDLYIEKNISLYEYYFGVNFDVNYIDNTILNIKREFINNSSLIQVLKGRGLPEHINNKTVYGDLYIYYTIVYPKYTNNIKNIRHIMHKYFHKNL